MTMPAATLAALAVALVLCDAPLALAGGIPATPAVRVTTTASPVHAAVYVGAGASTRAKANVPHVLAYPGSGIDVTVVNESSILAGALTAPNAPDVVVFPGGGSGTMSNALGVKGRAIVRDFIASGKGYVGICAGAYLAIQHLHVAAFEDEPRPNKGHDRGDGNVTLALGPNASVLPGVSSWGANLASTLVFYANGPVMTLASDTPGTGTPEVLLNFSSASVPIERHYTRNSGYRAIAVGTNTFAASGSAVVGRVVVSGPHPETNPLDMPATDGPPSAPGSVRAHILQDYVLVAAGRGTRSSQ